MTEALEKDLKGILCRTRTIWIDEEGADIARKAATLNFGR